MPAPLTRLGQINEDLHFEAIVAVQEDMMSVNKREALHNEESLLSIFDPRVNFENTSTKITNRLWLYIHRHPMIQW